MIKSITNPTASTNPMPAQRKPRTQIRKKLWQSRYMYMFILPGLLYFLLYKYVPLLGSIIAFKDYSVFRGFGGSPWVGFKHFERIFASPEVVQVLMNTLYLSFLQILFAFPAPILLALMLNEVRKEWLKRIIQSIVYLPHFLSWVVIVGVVTIFLRSDGLINNMLGSWFDISSIPFLQMPELFKPLLVLEVMWKETGWGTIIFLAALAGVNPEQYEAAVVDGAGRMRRIWHITLPAIRSTIIILLILRLGSVLDNGFEQVFLMLNPYVMEVGNVLDTYVYYKGIEQSNFSFATAVGLFKSVIGLILVVGANRLAKKFGEEGIY